MNKHEDLTGKLIGNWKIIKLVRVNSKGNNVWLCECQCEKKTLKELSEANLKRLSPKSCGCLVRKAGRINKKYNTYDLSGEYGIGYTFDGVEFYFDLEDYDKIKNYCWCLSKTTNSIVARISGQNKNISLHQLVMDSYYKGHKVQVDHIYHNRRDNRESKLRVCTNGENQRNKDKPITNTSGHIGVSYSKRDNLWHAYISKDRKRRSAWFHSYEEAVRWREEQAEQLFGEFNYKKEESNE